jgi:hypothetical protein
MWLNSLHKSQSNSILVVFFLIIAFIVPLYHYHEHPAEYYHHNGDGHYAEFDHPDKDIHESLSVGHKHVGPHLHIQKNISCTNANNGLQIKLHRSSALNSASYALTCLRVFNGIAYDYQKLRPNNSFAKAFSGLSPPAC